MQIRHKYIDYNKEQEILIHNTSITMNMVHQILDL